jgi:hypothetical protein
MFMVALTTDTMMSLRATIAADDDCPLGNVSRELDTGPRGWEVTVGGQEICRDSVEEEEEKEEVTGALWAKWIPRC